MTLTQSSSKSRNGKTASERPLPVCRVNYITISLTTYEIWQLCGWRGKWCLPLCSYCPDLRGSRPSLVTWPSGSCCEREPNRPFSTTSLNLQEQCSLRVVKTHLLQNNTLTSRGVMESLSAFISTAVTVKRQNLKVELEGDNMSRWKECCFILSSSSF